MSRNHNVFVNAPFDNDYEPLFEALVFTITACGYRVRCALEEDNSGDIRLEKLLRLIRESPRSIHDLSRIELNKDELPRFNMPLELGLALGAKKFGRGRRDDAIKIIVRERYKFPAYLSDLAGNDLAEHCGDVEKVIRHVRNFLHKSPDGTNLAGPAKLMETFIAFKAGFAADAEEIHCRPYEITAFADYRTFMDCIFRFFKRLDLRDIN